MRLRNFLLYIYFFLCQSSPQILTQRHHRKMLVNFATVSQHVFTDSRLIAKVQTGALVKSLAFPCRINFIIIIIRDSVVNDSQMASAESAFSPRTPGVTHMNLVSTNTYAS